MRKITFNVLKNASCNVAMNKIGQLIPILIQLALVFSPMVTQGAPRYTRIDEDRSTEDSYRAKGRRKVSQNAYHAIYDRHPEKYLYDRKTGVILNATKGSPIQKTKQPAMADGTGLLIGNGATKPLMTRTWTATKNGVTKRIEGAFTRYDQTEDRFYFISPNGRSFYFDRQFLSAADMAFIQQRIADSRQSQQENTNPSTGVSDSTQEMTRRAEKGDANAQYALGEILMTGDPENETAAVYWWTKAAAQGHVEAREMLAGLQEVQDDKRRMLKRQPRDVRPDESRDIADSEDSIFSKSIPGPQKIYKTDSITGIREPGSFPIGVVEGDKIYRTDSITGIREPGSSSVGTVEKGRIYRTDSITGIREPGSFPVGVVEGDKIYRIDPLTGIKEPGSSPVGLIDTH